MLAKMGQLLLFLISWSCFWLQSARGHDDTTGGPIPIIDIAPLFWKSFPQFFHHDTIMSIKHACENVGFFYISGMPYDTPNMQALEAEADYFFSRPAEEKRRIHMKLAGRAWRGYFAVGDELTSGIPDQKEGIYFGTEDPEEDSGKPLHGRNLYPAREYLESSTGANATHFLFQRSVTLHMKSMRQIGTALMQAIALSLDLPHDTFDKHFARPTELLRVFSYPPHNPSSSPTALGVGEHTDYGFITILHQDPSGGLQVRDAITNRWIDAAPVTGSFVVNLGDALEHFTGGLYRATPHRVNRADTATHNPNHNPNHNHNHNHNPNHNHKHNEQKPRVSIPYFFDPSFDSPMTSIAATLPKESLHLIAQRRDRERRDGQAAYSRWDNADPTLFAGTYGDYLKRKISKVFPELFAAAVDEVHSLQQGHRPRPVGDQREEL